MQDTTGLAPFVVYPAENKRLHNASDIIFWMGV